MKNVKLKRILPLLAMLIVLMAFGASAAYGDDNDDTVVNKDEYGYDREWWNFRNREDNNGVTGRPALKDKEYAALKWATRHGTGWAASPTPPIIINGKIYIGVGNKICRLNKDTGKVEAESEAMPGKVGYAMNPFLYAEGKIFAQIEQGQVCAVNIENLKIAWITEKIGGQTVSPISYKKIDGKGYIYTGTWYAENQDGCYICATADDQNVVTTQEYDDDDKPINVRRKKLEWKFTPSKNDAKLASSQQYSEYKKRGFYWAGSYVAQNYVAVGTDDGAGEGSEKGNAIFYTLDPKTGAVIDRIDGVKGDIRSTVVYHEGKLFFSTKGGQLHRVSVTETGKLSEHEQMDLGGMATASALIHKDRLYIGVAGKGGQFDPDGGHRFSVIDVKGKLSDSSLIYNIPVKGYPQAAALMSTSEEKKDYDNDGKPDGRVYVYFTYNAPPGGVYYFYDEPGRKEPPSEQGEIYIPSKDKQQYCISTMCMDRAGNLYYKNDSGYLMAIEKNEAYIKDAKIQADAGNLKWDSDFKYHKTEYEIKADSETRSINLKLELAAGITAKINGEEYNTQAGSDIALNNEETEVKVEVVKEEYKRTYTFKIVKESANANLVNMNLSGSNTAGKNLFKFTRTFDSGVYDYETEYTGEDIPNGFFRLWPEAENRSANINVYAVSNIRRGKFNKTTKEISKPADRSYYGIYLEDDGKDAKIRVKVTSENGKQSREYNLTIVRRIRLVSIGLDAEKMLTVGESTQLKVMFTPENAADRILGWKSGNEGIVSVDDTGKIEAKKEGETSITAQNKETGLSATCRVKVVFIGKIREYFKEKIKTYKNKNDYRKTEQDKLQAIIDKAVEEIDKADTGVKIEEIAEKAKLEIDRLKTDQMYKSELERARKEGKRKLDNYKKESDYREAEWEKIKKIITDAKTEVDAADSPEQVDEIVKTAKGKMDVVKDKLFYEKVEEAKNEVKEYKNTSDYREAEKALLKKIVEDAVTAIEKADNETEIREAVNDAKKKMDELKTNAAYNSEAQAALDKSKAEAKERLRRHKGDEAFWSKSYRDAERKKRLEILKAAEKAVDNAATNDEIAGKEADAKKKLDELKSDADYVKAAKDAAIREIEKYKDEAQYRPAQKQEFKDIVAEAKERIEKAEDEETVKKIKKETKALLDELKTDLDFCKEEKKGEIVKYVEELKAKNSYYPAEQAKIDVIVSKTESRILDADTKDELDEVVNSAKGELAEVKTKETVLKETKESVIGALKVYKKKSDYRPQEQKKIDEIIEEAIRNINAATTMGQIIEYEIMAYDKLDEVKTKDEIGDEDEETPDEEVRPTEKKAYPSTVQDAVENAVRKIVKKVQKSAQKSIGKVKKIKLKRGKAKVTVVFKKVSRAKGYQISVKKVRKKGKWKTYATGRTKFVIKKLNAKAKYYIRVRAYGKNGGKRIYGAWSKPVSIRLK